MDLEILKKIIQKASWAPSGDNCQPWRFNWNGKQLKIYHIEVRAHHSLNFNNQVSLFTLGGLIEYLHIASLHYGYEPTFTLPDPTNLDPNFLTQVHFKKTTPQPQPLFEALSLRATDRRPFKNTPLDEKIVNNLLSVSKDFKQANAYVCTAPSEELKKYLVASEVLLFSNKAFLFDIIKWVRFRNKETIDSKDGLPWRNLGVGLRETIVLWLIKRYPKLYDLFKHMGMYNQVSLAAQKLVKSHTTFICFTVKSNENHLIESGRLALRSWLLLAKHGVSAQPMSSGAMLLYKQIVYPKDNFSTKAMTTHFNNGRLILQSSFGFSESERPIWLLRVGLSDPLNNNMKTYRRSVDQIFEVEA